MVRLGDTAPGRTNTVDVHKKPETVWLLPPDPWEEPFELSLLEQNRLLVYYDDTGWELDVDVLHDWIGSSYFEAVPLPGIGVLWIDESGRRAKREANPMASILYARTLYAGAVVAPIQGVVGAPIQGPAVLVAFPDVSKERVKAKIQGTFRIYQHIFAGGMGTDAEA